MHCFYRLLGIDGTLHSRRCVDNHTDTLGSKTVVPNLEQVLRQRKEGPHCDCDRCTGCRCALRSTYSFTPLVPSTHSFVQDRNSGKTAALFASASTSLITSCNTASVSRSRLNIISSMMATLAMARPPRSATVLKWFRVRRWRVLFSQHA